MSMALPTSNAAATPPWLAQPAAQATAAPVPSTADTMAPKSFAQTLKRVADRSDTRGTAPAASSQKAENVPADDDASSQPTAVANDTTPSTRDAAPNDDSSADTTTPNPQPAAAESSLPVWLSPLPSQPLPTNTVSAVDTTSVPSMLVAQAGDADASTATGTTDVPQPVSGRDATDSRSRAATPVMPIGLNATSSAPAGKPPTVASAAAETPIASADQTAAPRSAPASSTAPRTETLAALGNTDQPSGTAPAASAAAASNWSAVLSGMQNPADNASATPTVKLPAGQPTQWHEPLLNALGERVQWQLQRGSEQATIRLEPPNLGRLDIVIRQEAGALQVHLSATHREVVAQLQDLSDSLRGNLAGRNTLDVAVQVSQQSLRDAPQRQRGQQETTGDAAAPGRALGDAADESGTPRTFALPTTEQG